MGCVLFLEDWGFMRNDLFCRVTRISVRDVLCCFLEYVLSSKFDDWTDYYCN